MKDVIYKTVWGKALTGVQYDAFEFVDCLSENINANNIGVDEDEKKILFIVNKSKHYEFLLEDIISITQYIEEDMRVWNFYYQVETKNELYEFSISAYVRV